jgi:hypothetical protein
MKCTLATLVINVTNLPVISIVTSVIVVAKVAVGFIVTVLTKLPTSFLFVVATRSTRCADICYLTTLLSALTFHFSCAIKLLESSDMHSFPSTSSLPTHVLPSNWCPTYFEDGAVCILTTSHCRYMNYAADSILCSGERGWREKLPGFVVHRSLCCQILVFTFVLKYNRVKHKAPERNPWIRSRAS